MKIVEMFKSIDGEGKRTGEITTFIRFYGCNLDCTYCDSMYANAFNNYDNLCLDYVLGYIAFNNCNNITITGGEPLLHKKDIREIIENLPNTYDINIETNGSIDIADMYYDNVFFTVDYKLKNSGEFKNMNLDIFKNQLREKDVVKFVVSDTKDLDDMKDIINRYNLKCKIYVGGVYGIDNTFIIDYLKNNNLTMCIFQLQIHKYIWRPDMKGV